MKPPIRVSGNCSTQTVSLILQSVLAAIIYVNLHSMMKQFLDIPALWKSNRVDMVSALKKTQGSG